MFKKGDIVKLHKTDNPELDTDTRYTVWNVKDEIAEIYTYGESFDRVPKIKWSVSIHDLNQFNWEIKSEGDLWRFYFRDLPVSQIPKTGSMTKMIKLNLSSQGFCRTTFGYLVFEDHIVHRCVTCKKNYRLDKSTAVLQYSSCSSECEDEAIEGYNI
jgi:hypothetical protein